MKGSLDKIRKEASSRSIIKWIGRFEGEINLVAEGDTPTRKMEDLIQKIKQCIEYGKGPDESINELIKLVFEQGVQGGFAKALSRVGDGAITTRKKSNEDSWVLYSNSSRYQITAILPTAEGGSQKTTVKIKLPEHGFE